MEKSLKIETSTEELKKLISENPDLPIVVLASQDVCMGSDYYYTIAPNVSFGVQEYLDHIDYDENIIDDRDYLRECISDFMADDEEYENLSDAEFDLEVDKKMKEYEPYWKKAIFIYADV